MNIQFGDRFLDDYSKLSSTVQLLVDKKLEVLATNIRHPSLRVKKIHGHKKIWELSVTMKYRISFEITTDVYYLRRVGEHDKVLGSP
jgi:mRNA-degrading endonuclease RelE of RelBE toxin-antitoxin system